MQGFWGAFGTPEGRGRGGRDGRLKGRGEGEEMWGKLVISGAGGGEGRKQSEDKVVVYVDAVGGGRG